MAIYLLICSRIVRAAPCDRVDRQLTAARQQQYASLVARSIRTPHIPQDIHVAQLMQSGPWSAAWGESKDFEPGVFFFRQATTGPRFVDVWGGWAVPEDRPQLIKWVHALGKDVPDDLPVCLLKRSRRDTE
jgi:hypothetical protein